MGYRQIVGLCMAMVACAGTSTIDLRKGGKDDNAVPPAVEVCGHVPCAVGESCCLTTFACFDPVAHPEVCPRPPADDGSETFSRCASNAHCPLDALCVTQGLCGGTGQCMSRAHCPSCEDCTAVCGCDGNTYSSPHAACLVGVNSAKFRGAGCGESLGLWYGDDPTNGFESIDAPSPEADDELTLCGSDSDCPREGDACCAVTAVCYPRSDPGRCAVPPPGTSYPCTSNLQCSSHEYCAGDGCGTPGGCVDRYHNDRGCGEFYAPVCGCDGVDYTSAQCAVRAGIRVASEGECP